MRRAFYRFLRWCPGALGIFLRQKLFPFYLKSCGHGVLFGRFVDLINARNISLGRGTVISNRAELRAGDHPDKTITIRDNVFIGIATRLDATRGTILLSEGTNIGSDCLLAASKSLVLEKNVLVAAYCEIADSSSISRQGTLQEEGKGLTIGEGTWLGARCRVAAGIDIGSDVVAGAHSVILTDVEDNSVIVGNPASVLRKRILRADANNGR